MSTLVKVVTTVQPAAEPVTVQELKDFLRLDASDEDTLLGYLITSARQACEQWCDLAFITQTKKALYDGAPEASYLDLPAAPLLGVTSVDYLLAADSATTAMSSGDYRVDTVGCRVILNQGKAWPTGLAPLSSFSVTFTTGYGASASAVPQAIKDAIKVVAGHMFEYRGGLGDAPDKVTPKLPGAAKLMLQPFVRFSA